MIIFRYRFRYRFEIILFSVVVIVIVDVNHTGVLICMISKEYLTVRCSPDEVHFGLDMHPAMRFLVNLCTVA